MRSLTLRPSRRKVRAVKHEQISPVMAREKIVALVKEAHRLQEEERDPFRTPESERIARYWKEYRPKMYRGLVEVAPEAPLALATHRWRQAFRQAKDTINNFPTFSEAMQEAEKDNLLMESEEDPDLPLEDLPPPEPT